MEDGQKGWIIKASAKASRAKYYAANMREGFEAGDFGEDGRCRGAERESGKEE